MLSDLGEDLLVGREPIGLVLGVDDLAVDRDVEDAAVAALQVGCQPELLLDRGLPTGGLGGVVSLEAVGDLDPHRPTSLPMDWNSSSAPNHTRRGRCSNSSPSA